ncbi:MAG: cobalamin-binding protein [Nitrospirae bacterium]|nr:cobalamin-binding protein [Nitrospirota bacterium]
MKRVISLIPSATEMVSALGCESWLVGRSHECDFPPSVQSLPVCTEPKFDPTGSSRDIDDRVKGLLQNALSVYEVKKDVLQQLGPDLIVTQAQCEVCAVSLSDVERTVAEWVESKPSIVSLSPNRLADVWDDLLLVAKALEVPEVGERLKAQLQSRVSAIHERTSQVQEHPTVGCVEWLDPLMASANWMPELVAYAGGRNVFGEAGAHAPWITWEGLREQDPDVVVLLPCGFNIARTRSELSVLTSKEGWSELTAVRHNRVYVLDGNQYFNRSGPRLVESVEILAEIFHPTVCDFGHQGKGWEKIHS